jgi:hypothetical protein
MRMVENTSGGAAERACRSASASTVVRGSIARATCRAQGWLSAAEIGRTGGCDGSMHQALRFPVDLVSDDVSAVWPTLFYMGTEVSGVSRTGRSGDDAALAARTGAGFAGESH